MRRVETTASALAIRKSASTRGNQSPRPPRKAAGTVHGRRDRTHERASRGADVRTGDAFGESPDLEHERVSFVLYPVVVLFLWVAMTPGSTPKRDRRRAAARPDGPERR